MIAVLAIGGVFGSLIGSFINVVVHRVPIGRSVIFPSSACTTCGTRIRAYDNVPMLSWLLLRGRCRSCGYRISLRYPAVELATGVFFALVLLRFLPPAASAGASASLVSAMLGLIAFLYLAAISVALGLIDVDVRRLPNVIVLPAYAVGAVLLGASSLLSGDLEALLRAAVGGGACFLLYLALALAKPGGMGFGDVKLAGVLGLFLGWLGWEQLVVGVFLAFLLGGLFGVVLIVTRRARASTGVAFGPWMLLGAWLSVFAAPAVWSAYLRAAGLL